MSPCGRLTLVLLGLGAAAAAAGPDAEWYQETRELYYGLPVSVSCQPALPAVAAQAWAALEAIDGVFNDYRDDSEIGRVNALSATGVFRPSPALRDAFAKAREAYRLSDGVFDVSCGPIRRLWRNAEKTGVEPTAAAVAAGRGKCGLPLLEDRGDDLYVSRAGMQFDFGGIVKGIAVDEAIAILKNGGARSALVQVGGETGAFGPSPKARPYRIAIRHPLDRTAFWGVIQDPGTGLSCSTSGNYENPIILNGKTLYHIFDPRTGRPIPTDVLSVSIAFPTTGKNWLADCLATTGAILGPEKTFAILAKLGGEALFVLRDGDQARAVTSPGWRTFSP